MKVANILPNNCIDEKMPRQEIEMYLTHQILANPDIFSFLANDRNNDVKSFKILDNSACELGDGLDIKDVLKAAKIIDADEIVLPDTPRSGSSLSKTIKYLQQIPQDCKLSIAAVVQGSTIEEVLYCAQQILLLKRVNTIMIPKWYCNMNSSNGLGRQAITNRIISFMNDMNITKQIHWLGLGTGMRELITPYNKIIRSVDTGYLAAISTPQWLQLSLFDDRPRELKIDLNFMPVNTFRWEQLVQQQKQFLEGELQCLS